MVDRLTHEFKRKIEDWKDEIEVRHILTYCIQPHVYVFNLV